jgi:hypothetical protein
MTSSDKRQEKAPTLEQMESAKTALLTFTMYYYQALRQSGKDVETAKKMVAEEILSLYDKYAQLSGITFRPDRLRDPHQVLEEIIADAKALGTQGAALYRKLLDFKALIS